MGIEYMTAIVIAVTQLIKGWIKDWKPGLSWKGYYAVIISVVVVAGVILVPMYAPPWLKTGLIVFFLATGGKKYLVNPVFKK